MTCSVGQACSGFDGSIKKNHLSSLCNMPDKGSFPRTSSLDPSKENRLGSISREKDTDTLGKTLEEVAVSVSTC